MAKRIVKARNEVRQATREGVFQGGRLPGRASSREGVFR
jgi:hypothetical protein